MTGRISHPKPWRFGISKDIILFRVVLLRHTLVNNL